jgi:hypothetical protein
MAKVQKIQQPEHTPEELAKLREQQRKHQEIMDRINAEFSRPGAWTIGKELGGQWLAAGIVNAIAEHGPDDWALFAEMMRARALGTPMVELFPARVQAVLRGCK